MSILADLKHQGVKLELEGNDLKLPPKKKPPAELLEKIKANKKKIIMQLRKESSLAKPSSSQEISQALSNLELGITGYIKFYSHALNEMIYLVRENQIIELPENLVCFTLNELEKLANCSKDHLKNIFYTKKELKALVINRSDNNAI